MAKRRSTAADRAHPVAREATQPAPPPAIGPSRLEATADAAVEATCLAAVVLLPLYFSLLSPLGPETDKAVVLIVLAVIAAGAWLVGALCRAGRHLAGVQPNLLLWLGLSAFLAYAIATAFSIHPSESLFGSITRHQGLLTHAAYAVFFVCAATRLRRKDQIDRLITVLVFASAPAVIYALLQQFGFDPAPTQGDQSTVQWPVRSSFGQHIFYAAYLVLVIPLTGTRLLEAWDRRSAPPARGAGDEPLLAGVLVLFSALSFLGFLAMGKQVPALFALLPATLAGYALLGVGFAELPETLALRRTRVWLYGGLLSLQVLTLIFTSARGPWLGFFATLPVFALLVAWWLRRPRVTWSILGFAAAVALFILLLNIPGGPLGPLRTQHVFSRVSNIAGYANESSGAGRLLIWHGVATLMTQHPGIGNTWGGVGRDVVGYGPESLDQAFEAVFPLQLRVETSEIYTWDRAHDIYLDTLVDAGILGLLTFLATVLVFAVRALRTLSRRDALVIPLAIGLLSAVAGHLVEGIFGLETAATLLIVWIFLGLGAGPAMSGDGPEVEQSPAISWMRPAVIYWVGLALLTLALLPLGSLADHPAAIAALWLCATVAGVAAVTWLLRAPAPAPLAAKGKMPARVRVPAGVRAGAAALAAVVLLALLSQWEYERAAFAESAGFRNLTHAQSTAQEVTGIAGLQEAAQVEDAQPKYLNDLASIYTGLASTNPQGSNPGYVVQPGDASAVAPEVVFTLNRDQLYALSADALNRIRALTPLDPGVHGSLGDLYLSWHRPAQALTAYSHAERLSHLNPRYIDGQALAELASNRPAAALQRAQRAFHWDPTYWYSYYALARIHHQLGNVSAARDSARLALEWVHNYRPSPSSAQLAELRAIEKSG